MITYQRIAYAQTGAVVRITLNHPDAANSMDHVMTRELAHAAARCDRDVSVKAVLLTGSGKFFSSGGNLKAMMAAGEHASEYLKSLADDLHRALSTFARMDAPVVIAVNGIAAGAGMSLACAGDLVVASTAASFTAAYTKAGLSPDGSATYFLPRVIGLRRTQELLLTNRTLSASEALEWGLVNYVLPAESFMDKAQELAEQLAAGPWGAHSAVKKLLFSTYGAGLEAQLELEGRLITRNFASADGQEGTQAFRDKRAAKFSTTRGY